MLGRWCLTGIVVSLSGVWAHVAIAFTLVLRFFFPSFLLLFVIFLLSLPLFFLLFPFFFLLFMSAVLFALPSGIIVLFPFVFVVAGVTVLLSFWASLALLALPLPFLGSRGWWLRFRLTLLARDGRTSGS